MAVDPTKLPPPDPEIGKRAQAALNRLCKWRIHFAGWQLGTRAKGDPESDAVRDHREITMLMRVELSALVALLISKGVFTGDEWAEQLREEAVQLSAAYERRWPGVRPSDSGLVYDDRAKESMKGWRP